MLQPLWPISYELQVCPFFFPGCNCMTDGVACWPFYSVGVDKAKAVKYTENMAYIPRPSTPMRENAPNVGLPEPPIQIQPTSLPANLTSQRMNQIQIGQWSSPTPPTSLDNHPPQVDDEPMSLGNLDSSKRASESPSTCSPKHRRTASEGVEQDDIQPKSKSRKTARTGYDNDAKTWAAHYVQLEIANGNRTESKWERVSEQLKMHGIYKTKWSIKNWWSRSGRCDTGMEERQNPSGRKLVTSKQNPEDRRKARERKKLEAKNSVVLKATKVSSNEM
ncbi:MAG: hypothetical protein Q9218_000438 [Villophora microphyllina]